MKKPGRNDPCPCGSGKKFKKCCETTMLGGRFKVEKAQSSGFSAMQKMAQMASVFKARLDETPKKPAAPKEPPESPGESEKNGSNS